jgi:NitT/TauT family transport system ATP-binding protein
MAAGTGELRARLSGVTKIFDTGSRQSAVHALGPVDLDLAAGEFVTVVGPSGCGKTTLLETLAGLTRPSAGTVTFEGKAVTDKVPRGIGIVFQEDASLPWLTVWDNIAFGLRRAGMPADEIRARVDYAVSFMGLGAFAAAYPAQLSGGMRQRVCIARTLVLQPRLILLDEPFGALDQQTIDEAVMLADRVGIMSARPGRFIELMETGWPVSRSSRMVEEEAFGRLTAHVWSKLRAEAMKALGRDGNVAEFAP